MLKYPNIVFTNPDNKALITERDVKKAIGILQDKISAYNSGHPHKSVIGERNLKAVARIMANVEVMYKGVNQNMLSLVTTVYKDVISLNSSEPLSVAINKAMLLFLKEQVLGE